MIMTHTLITRKARLSNVPLYTKFYIRGREYFRLKIESGARYVFARRTKGAVDLLLEPDIPVDVAVNVKLLSEINGKVY